MRYYSLWCVRLFWGKHGTTSKNQTWQENATTTTTTTFPNAFSPQTKMIKPSKPNRTPNLHHVSRLVFLQAFHTLPLAFVASYWAFVILDTSTGRPRRSRVTPVEGWGNLQNGDSRWGGVIWLLVALHSKQKRFCQWRKTPGLSTPKIILRVFKPESSQKSLLSKPVLVNIATRIPTKTNPAISRPLCFFCCVYKSCRCISVSFKGMTIPIQPTKIRCLKTSWVPDYGGLRGSMCSHVGKLCYLGTELRGWMMGGGPSPELKGV